MLKNYYIDVWASLRQLRSLSLPAYNSGYAVRSAYPNPYGLRVSAGTLLEILLKTKKGGHHAKYKIA